MTTQQIKVHPAGENSRLNNTSSHGQGTVHVTTKAECRPKTARERITNFFAELRPFSSKKSRSHASESASTATERDWRSQILKYCTCKAFKPKGARNASKSQRSTVRQIKDPTGPEICDCGHSRTDHGDSDSDTACKPAFGEVQFVGHTKTAKYARVSSEAVRDVADVWRLITEEWDLSPPSLVISLVGGSKNFRLKTRLEEAFRQGLRSAARQSGAWLTTTGLHRGVMKQAGRVVRDCGLTSESRVTAIGIAPWSCVHNKELLMNNDGTKVVEYQVSEVEHDTETTSLDPHHTHFLFYDDTCKGTSPQYGSEIDFRVALENYISDKAIAYKTTNSTESVQVAVTMLVVEGGLNTLQTVERAIKEKIPVILMKGSGRCADILAEAKEADYDSNGAHGLTSKSQAIEEKIGRSFPKEADKVEQMVSRCVQRDKRHRMMSVFHVDPQERSSHDLDVAILRAFLKAKELSVTRKMELAIAWNRVDVARNEIMADIEVADSSPSSSVDSEQQTTSRNGAPEENQIAKPPSRRDLHGLLKMSIEKRHRAEFVELLLEHDVSLKEFLRDRELFAPLQKTTSKDKMAPTVKKRDSEDESVLCSEGGENEADGEDDESSSSDEESEKKGCMKLFCRRGRGATCVGTSEEDEDKCLELLYEHTKALGTTKPDRDIKERISSRVKKLLGRFYRKPKYPDTKEETAQRLFIWAVLSGRFDLARVFLKESTDTMGAALMAVALIKATRKRYDRTSVEEIHRLERHAGEFEDLAIGVLNACYADNEKKTRKVLKRELPVWGRSSCILLAMKADTKRFLSQPACQAFINFIWMDELFVHTNRLVKMLPCMFLPVIIPKAVKFRKEEKFKLEKKVAADGRDKRIPAWKKIAIFYHTPMVIFYLNFMSYAAFLCLYSYILLVQLSPEWHYLEYVLAIWVLTISMEEVRQFTPFSSSKSGSVRNRWKNSLDLIVFFGFLIGGILRILGLYVCNDCLDWARLILGANVIPCFFRLLVFYTINKELGPKLVMIRRMVHDLTWFVVILLVFVASYAVASESILYPNAQLSWQFLFHLPRKAYWQIYGELFLEDIEGDSPCTDDPARYRDYSEQRCPSDLGQYAVPLLTGLYVLLTNILLINLLIAMFSNTFQKVQENTDMHWHCQRFNLIFEYAERPDFPPPLNIIIYIFWILTGKKHESRFRKRVDEKKIRKQMEKHSQLLQTEAKTEEERQARNERAMKLQESIAKIEKKKRKDAQLVEWEKLIADGFFISANEKGSMENKVDAMRQSIENLQMKVDYLTEYHSRLHPLTSTPDPSEETSTVPKKSAQPDADNRPPPSKRVRSTKFSETRRTSGSLRGGAAGTSRRQSFKLVSAGSNPSQASSSGGKTRPPSTSSADISYVPPPVESPEDATRTPTDSSKSFASVPAGEVVPEAPVYHTQNDSRDTEEPPRPVLADNLAEARTVDVSFQLQVLQQQILQAQENHFLMMSERIKELEEQLSRLLTE